MKVTTVGTLSGFQEFPKSCFLIYLPDVLQSDETGYTDDEPSRQIMLDYNRRQRVNSTVNFLKHVTDHITKSRELFFYPLYINLEVMGIKYCNLTTLPTDTIHLIITSLFTNPQNYKKSRERGRREFYPKVIKK